MSAKLKSVYGYVIVGKKQYRTIKGAIENEGIYWKAPDPDTVCKKSERIVVVKVCEVKKPAKQSKGA